MKDTLKKIISIFMAVLMMLGTFTTNVNITKTYAQSNLIKAIEVKPETIQHGQYFAVDVKFGGPNTKVNQGHTETIDFTPHMANITLPNQSIPLQNRDKTKTLGQVTFEGKRAILTFNGEVDGLDDVEGGFHFSVLGTYTGDIREEGQGTIDITGGTVNKRVIVKNSKGGYETENIYSKKGIWIGGNRGNQVKWRFRFNAAHKPNTYEDIRFEITDVLDKTMEWDLETIKDPNGYVVQFQGEWMNLQRAEEMQIKIEIQENNLKISIPAHVLDA